MPHGGWDWGNVRPRERVSKHRKARQQRRDAKANVKRRKR